jgi:cellulose synthase/poly-beta-1,6-N-acetylglucosamine synthase-like glycosyltransferase
MRSALRMGVNRAFFAARAAVRRMHGPAADASRPGSEPAPTSQAPTSSAPPLPASLTFLQSEAPAHVLHGALARAQRAGVSPEQVVLGEGLLTEDAYYRAMARWLRLPFQPDVFEVGAGARYPESILTGLAPGPEGVWLAAPAGARIAATAAFRRRSNLHLTITTPTTLRRSVERAHAREAAREASDSLERADAQATSRTGASGQQAAFAGLMLGVVALALAPAGALQAAAATIVAVVAAACIILRTVAACASLPRSATCPPLADCDLPVYTVIAALYREAPVAAKLIRALDALDYPAAKLDIKLVVEEDDAETRVALERLALPARYHILVAPTGAPRTKPRALNIGLAQARGDLVAIFDAEDEPEPDQLRKAAAAFALASPQVGCLQGRLAIDNVDDGWLTRLFAIEYAALFRVLNPGLSRLGAPVALGGTSNHFRADALRDVGGWDAWNVTEDIDLGFRLARHGYRVGALDSTTHEEAPARLRAWLRQRRRWFKGWIQTFLTHTRAPGRLVREAGAMQGASAMLLVAGGLLGPLFGPAFAVSLLTAGAGETPDALWISIAAAGLASASAPALIGLVRADALALAPWLALAPVYWLLMSIAAWWALIDLARDPFHWHKTEHGLARSSLRGRRRPPAIDAGCART